MLQSQTAQTFHALEEQRANLLRAFHAAEKQRKKSVPDSPECVAAKARLTALNDGLKMIREQTRDANDRSWLDRFLVEIIRERMDQIGWAELVQAARERRAVLEVLKITGEHLAVAGAGAMAIQLPPAGPTP